MDKLYIGLLVACLATPVLAQQAPSRQPPAQQTPNAAQIANAKIALDLGQAMVRADVAETQRDQLENQLSQSLQVNMQQAMVLSDPDKLVELLSDLDVKQDAEQDAAD